MAAMTTATPEITTADLMDAVAGVSAAFWIDFAAAAAAHGLSATQAKALSAVQEPVPMRALAERLGCDASNVTGIVDRLESLGLATRAAGAADRRVKMVTITPAGNDVMHAIRADMARAHRALESLDAEQRTALIAMCAQLLPLMKGETAG
jgi:DNA-binding MarR family transcriptional regulator